MSEKAAAPASSPQIVYIALGANVGIEPEKLARLRAAVCLLSDTPGVTVLRTSSVYRTPAWGVTDQPDFLNAVIEVRTTVPPAKLLSDLKCIEQQLGRVKRERWGQREIDLDILLYGEMVLQTEALTIPHPGLLERSFVLIPLLGIAPKAKLPDGRQVAEAAAIEVLSDSKIQSTGERL
jgi:2-amino-4-hydroxy-6-hydroxymethyldihydropteridine diphosphokinase